MNEEYVAKTVLNALSIEHLYPNVYFIGPFAERVSFASQQRRALNLLWALEQTNSISGKQVAVVGGGVAGLTAAAAAITCGADVSLFEKEHDLCSAQREIGNRYIHPSLNFWPQEPLQVITEWPFLNWYAGPCRTVIKEIEKQWNDYFSWAAEVQTPTKVLKISTNKDKVQLDIGGGASRTFELVICAVGFGKEDGLPHVPVDSYWSDNDIDRRSVTEDRKIWISGAGDGALIDCLRVCYSGFDIGRLLMKVAVEINPLADYVSGIESNALEIDSLDDRSSYLANKYRELAQRPRVKSALSPALARATFLPLVILVHRTREPFELRTAPIHRLLFAVAVEQGLVRTIRGELQSDAGGPLLMLYDKSTKRIGSTKLIARHGASGALEELITPNAIAVLKSDVHKKHQNELRPALWPLHFFENLPPARFPTAKREYTKFYTDAVRLLQGTLFDQGLNANVSVGPRSEQIELKATVLGTNSIQAKFVPKQVFGIVVKEEVEWEISRFHGGIPDMGRPELLLYPGAVVSLDNDSQEHVVTCLVTDPQQGGILGLCISHTRAPSIGALVRLKPEPQPVGTIVRVKQFDGALKETEDGDIVCIFFTIEEVLAVQAAPAGQKLTGLLRDPIELVTAHKNRQVTKWGPSAFSIGEVTSVSGIASIRTEKSDSVFMNVIQVEGFRGEPFSKPGDSGALVVSSEHLAVGVVFAGTSRSTFLLPLSVLLDRCDVDLLPSEEADPAPDPQNLLELGHLQIDQGKFRDAEATFKRSLDGFHRMLGPEHPKTADALHGLASVLGRLGRPAEAERLFRQALDVRERILGLDYPLTASTLEALGWVCGDQGKFEEAEGMFRRALEIRENVPEPNQLNIAEASRGLGSMLRRQNRFVEARTYLERAFELRRQTVGSEGVQVSDDLVELGWLNTESADFNKAKELFEQALEIRMRMLGPEHPQTAGALQGLASVLGRLGRPVEAERLLHQALDIRERALGFGHPATASTLQSLGWICGDLGKLDEAERLFRRALDIRQNAIGSSQLDIAQALRGLSWILRRQGHLVEAKECLERAVEIRRQTVGSEHVQVSDDLVELGWLSTETAEFGRAKELFEQALEIRMRVFGPEHPQTAAALQGLASVLGRLGRPAEAERLLHQVLDIRERVLGPDHPATASSLQSLGWILGDQGKLDEAEKSFRRALRIRENATGSSKVDIAEALRGLGAILRRLQKFDEADALLRRAFEIRKK